MRKINVLCVGTIKEDFIKQGINEYLKRLSKFCQIKIVELNEFNYKNNNPSESERFLILENEKRQIIDKLSGYIISLCIEGKELDSIELSNTIKKIYNTNSEITIIIGGSYGLSEEIKKKSNLLLSFSKLTFPHQLMRLILLEQLYRATTIENNTPYHK